MSFERSIQATLASLGITPQAGSASLKKTDTAAYLPTIFIHSDENPNSKRRIFKRGAFNGRGNPVWKTGSEILGVSTGLS